MLSASYPPTALGLSSQLKDILQALDTCDPEAFLDFVSKHAFDAGNLALEEMGFWPEEVEALCGAYENPNARPALLDEVEREDLEVLRMSGGVKAQDVVAPGRSKVVPRLRELDVETLYIPEGGTNVYRQRGVEEVWVRTGRRHRRDLHNMWSS